MATAERGSEASVWLQQNMVVKQVFGYSEHGGEASVWLQQNVVVKQVFGYSERGGEAFGYSGTWWEKR